MRRAAVFAHYDRQNSVHDYVIYYLKELAKVSDTIIFVSDCMLAGEELSKIKSITSYIIAKPHGEYDFGSYKRGFCFLEDNNLLNSIDELIFANDSCIAPLYSLKNVLEQMASKDCDFYSINSNDIDVDFHLQSFFIVFKKQVFNSRMFKNFILNIKKQEKKEDILKKYEIGLSKELINSGFKAASFIKCPIEQKITGNFIFPETLNPFLKTSTIRKSGWLFNAILSYWYQHFKIEYPREIITNYFQKYKIPVSIVKNINNIRRILLSIHTSKKKIYLLGHCFKW